MSATVWGAGNEPIGTVRDDLLLDREGQIIAIIVGVGGFLGIGEEKVAISNDQLEFVLTQDVLAAGNVPGAPAGTGTQEPALAPQAGGMTAGGTTAPAPAGTGCARPNRNCRYDNVRCDRYGAGSRRVHRGRCRGRYGRYGCAGPSRDCRYDNVRCNRYGAGSRRVHRGRCRVRVTATANGWTGSVIDTFRSATRASSCETRQRSKRWSIGGAVSEEGL